MKLPSNVAIQRVIRAAKDAGISIGSIDITATGVTIHSAQKEKTGSAFDRWKDQQSEARAAHR